MPNLLHALQLGFHPNLCSPKLVFSPKVVFSLAAGAPHTEQAVMGSVCQQPGCNESALAA